MARVSNFFEVWFVQHFLRGPFFKCFLLIFPTRAVIMKRKTNPITISAPQKQKQKKMEEEIKLEIGMGKGKEVIFPHSPNLPKVIVFEIIRKFSCENFRFLFRQWPLICKTWYLEVMKWLTKDPKQALREPHFWKKEQHSKSPPCPWNSSFPIYNWNLGFEYPSLSKASPPEAQPLVLSLTTSWDTSILQLKEALDKCPLLEEVTVKGFIGRQIRLPLEETGLLFPSLHRKSGSF